MGKLWLFGDSFCENHKMGNSKTLEKQWHRQVARELGLDYENFALGGTSLDWLIYMWGENRDKIGQDDLVVITLPDMWRRWIIKDFPNCGSIVALEAGHFDDRLNKKTITSAYSYFRRLYHQKSLKPMIRDWLYNVSDLARNRNCRVLIMPAFGCVDSVMKSEAVRFPEISIPKGEFLSSISTNEHVKKWRKTYPIHDGRMNHLVTPNHKILADKIIDWYKNGTEIDLSNGFLQNVIDKNNKNSPDLFLSEHKFVKVWW